MIGDWILTPNDIDEAPELASLAVLDVALQATRAVLLSIHKEMQNPQDEYRDPDIDHDTGVVRTLLVLGDALADQIDVYCKVLERRQRQEQQRIATRDF